MAFGFKLNGVGPPSYYMGGDSNIVNHVLHFGPTVSYGSEMMNGKENAAECLTKFVTGAEWERLLKPFLRWKFDASDERMGSDE